MLKMKGQLKLKEAKELNFEDDHFIANGVKYFYYGDMAKFGIQRYWKWQDLEPIITFGKDSMSIHRELSTAIKLINDSKHVQAHRALYDLWECLDKNLNDRTDSVLEACTLFMVIEGEDMEIWDEAKAKTKIDNWKKEGISYQSFFTFMVNFIPDYLNRCLETSQASLKKTPKPKPKPSTKKK